MSDLFSAFSLPPITTHPFPRTNAAVLTEGPKEVERLDGGIGIGCIEMKRVINLTGDFWKREVAGYSPPPSPTSSSYRYAQSSETETRAAGPCDQHTQQPPATQLCDSGTMNWTVNGSVPYPSYPCQLQRSEG